jgi:hypothetical protein
MHWLAMTLVLLLSAAPTALANSQAASSIQAQQSVLSTQATQGLQNTQLFGLPLPLVLTAVGNVLDKVNSPVRINTRIVGPSTPGQQVVYGGASAEWPSTYGLADSSQQQYIQYTSIQPASGQAQWVQQPSTAASQDVTATVGPQDTRAQMAPRGQIVGDTSSSSTVLPGSSQNMISDGTQSWNSANSATETVISTGPDSSAVMPNAQQQQQAMTGYNNPTQLVQGSQAATWPNSQAGMAAGQAGLPPASFPPNLQGVGMVRGPRSSWGPAMGSAGGAGAGMGQMQGYMGGVQVNVGQIQGSQVPPMQGAGGSVGAVVGPAMGMPAGGSSMAGVSIGGSSSGSDIGDDSLSYDAAQQQQQQGVSSNAGLGMNPRRPAFPVPGVREDPVAFDSRSSNSDSDSSSSDSMPRQPVASSGGQPSTSVSPGQQLPRPMPQRPAAANELGPRPSAPLRSVQPGIGGLNRRPPVMVALNPRQSSGAAGAAGDNNPLQPEG